MDPVSEVIIPGTHDEQRLLALSRTTQDQDEPQSHPVKAARGSLIDSPHEPSSTVLKYTSNLDDMYVSKTMGSMGAND